MCSLVRKPSPQKCVFLPRLWCSIPESQSVVILMTKAIHSQACWHPNAGREDQNGKPWGPEHRSSYRSLRRDKQWLLKACKPWKGWQDEKESWVKQKAFGEEKSSYSFTAWGGSGCYTQCEDIGIYGLIFSWTGVQNVKHMHSLLQISLSAPFPWDETFNHKTYF